MNGFNSITYGQLNMVGVIEKTADYLSQENLKGYTIIVGTDSNPHPTSAGQTEYISAVILHRVGGGGIYFWSKTSERKAYSLKERIYREATLSLELAHSLLGELHKAELLVCPLEIHVDVGNVGETREIINEVVGMIRGDGFEVKTKPNSFGASKVADRHT